MRYDAGLPFPFPGPDIATENPYNMRKFCALLFGIVLSICAWGQDYPRGELFVGYSYLRIDDGGVNTLAPNIFILNPWLKRLGSGR